MLAPVFGISGLTKLVLILYIVHLYIRGKLFITFLLESVIPEHKSAIGAFDTARDEFNTKLKNMFEDKGKNGYNKSLVFLILVASL